MIGQHLIQAWSNTQNHVTLTFAEAELYGTVKCTAELIGIKPMISDRGRKKSGTLYADSTAALGIARRKGAGKLRHINIANLWVQETFATEHRATTYAACNAVFQLTASMAVPVAAVAVDKTNYNPTPLLFGYAVIQVLVAPVACFLPKETAHTPLKERSSDDL